MLFRGTPIDELTKDHLKSLVKDKVREGPRLEFKREMYKHNPDDTREMLRDISAMANSEGGFLLIGVGEDEEGTAIATPGIENAETEAARLTSSCLDSIDPRIQGLNTKLIEVGEDRHVILALIAPSASRPHMITYRGLNQFWARHDRQKTKMSTHEIREAVLRREELMQRLERFLQEREEEARRIAEGRPWLLVSVTPVLDEPEAIPVFSEEIELVLLKLPRPGSNWPLHSGQPNPSLNGISAEKVLHRKDGQIEPIQQKIEVFQSGHIEFGTAYIADGNQAEQWLPPGGIPGFLMGTLNLAKKCYQSASLYSEVIATVALMNVKGWQLGPTGFRDPPGKPWPKSDLIVPRIRVPSLDDLDSIGQRLADRVWNAFAVERCPEFRDGKYQPAKQH